MSATRALALATIGGARALRLEGEVGTLEVGKAADIAAFPIAAHRVPVHDPVAALVFALAGARADFVAVAGKERVRDGRLIDADEGLSARVQFSADLLRKWLSA